MSATYSSETYASDTYDTGAVVTPHIVHRSSIPFVFVPKPREPEIIEQTFSIPANVAVVKHAFYKGLSKVAVIKHALFKAQETRLVRSKYASFVYEFLYDVLTMQDLRDVYEAYKIAKAYNKVRGLI
jgi:hypothetical protein